MALIYAIIHNDITSVKILATNQVDINMRYLYESELQSPLHIAVRHGHLEIAKILIDNGANVNTKSAKTGHSPLYIAANLNNLEIMELLLTSTPFGTKADVNITDYGGWTPLHIACRNNNLTAVQLLLNHQANIEMVTNWGETPLSLTTSSAIKELLTHYTDDEIKEPGDEYQINS